MNWAFETAKFSNVWMENEQWFQKSVESLQLLVHISKLAYII